MQGEKTHLCIFKIKIENNYHLFCLILPKSDMQNTMASADIYIYLGSFF